MWKDYLLPLKALLSVESSSVIIMQISTEIVSLGEAEKCWLDWMSWVHWCELWTLWTDCTLLKSFLKKSCFKIKFWVTLGFLEILFVGKGNITWILSYMISCTLIKFWLKYHFGPYILGSQSIWSLHFDNSQFGLYYF